MNTIVYQSYRTVFTRGNSFLEFGIWAHEHLVRDGTRVHATNLTAVLS